MKKKTSSAKKKSTVKKAARKSSSKKSVVKKSTVKSTVKTSSKKSVRKSAVKAAKKASPAKKSTGGPQRISLRGLFGGGKLVCKVIATDQFACFKKKSGNLVRKDHNVFPTLMECEVFYEID